MRLFVRRHSTDYIHQCEQLKMLKEEESNQWIYGESAPIQKSMTILTPLDYIDGLLVLE